MLRVTLLCDNPDSWIIPYIRELRCEIEKLGYHVNYIYNKEDITEGDIACFLSCERIIPNEYLKLNKHNLVVHESDLPKGKGWSPLTWLILEGKNRIPITLIEANEKIDSGDIYFKDYIELNGSELLGEIKHLQGMKTNELILKFIEQYPNISKLKQEGEETFYRKRTKDDSCLDINKTIEEQFNLLRVVDNQRYPAFFFKNGEKYFIKIYKE